MKTKNAEIERSLKRLEILKENMQNDKTIEETPFDELVEYISQLEYTINLLKEYYEEHNI